jgi:hypothetical protein
MWRRLISTSLDSWSLARKNLITFEHFESQMILLYGVDFGHVLKRGWISVLYFTSIDESPGCKEFFNPFWKVLYMRSNVVPILLMDWSLIQLSGKRCKPPPAACGPSPMFHPASGMENHDDEVQEPTGGRLIFSHRFFFQMFVNGIPMSSRSMKLPHHAARNRKCLFQSGEFPDSSNDGSRGQR